MGCAAHPTEKFRGGDQDESRPFAVSVLRLNANNYNFQFLWVTVMSKPYL